MNLVSVLLYPIALLLPAAGALESDSATRSGQDGVSSNEVAGQGLWPENTMAMLAGEAPLTTILLEHARPISVWQVHIEQRMQIRITPRMAVPQRRDMFVGIPDRDVRIELSERKMGNCLAIGGIAGVQPDKGSRLLLYMRDRRLVAADLERSCRARDFYSGFYLARTEDGQICVDRDSLLSRSGMNCKLTRLRQLVESER